MKNRFSVPLKSDLIIQFHWLKKKVKKTVPKPILVANDYDSWYDVIKNIGIA